MSLNNIHLSSSLLADFYKNHLVENSFAQPGTISPPETVSVKKRIKYLGENQKKICVLVEYSKEVYLPDEQLDFLTSIFQACKLTIADVAIINHYREKISFDELKTQLMCNYLLIFGIDTNKLGLGDISQFDVQNINECMIVYSCAAELLNSKTQESKLLKSKLWLCLKQMFNV